MSSLRTGARTFRPSSPQNLLIVAEQTNEGLFLDYVHEHLINIDIPILDRLQACTRLIQNVNPLLRVNYYWKSEIGFGCGRGSMLRFYLTISISENLFNPTSHTYLITLIERVQRSVNAERMALYGWSVLKFRGPGKAPDTVEITWNNRAVQADSELCIPLCDISYSLLCRYPGTNGVGIGLNQCEIAFFINDETHSTHINNASRLNDVKRALFRYVRILLGDSTVFRYVGAVHVLPRKQSSHLETKPLGMLSQDMICVTGDVDSCNFCNVNESYALLIDYEGYRVCHVCKEDDQRIMSGINGALYRGCTRRYVRVYGDKEAVGVQCEGSPTIRRLSGEVLERPSSAPQSEASERPPEPLPRATKKRRPRGERPARLVSVSV